MQNEALFLSIVAGVAIFLFIIGISAVIYQNNIKFTRFYKENPEDWFFYKFNSKIYEAIFGFNDPEDIALKLNIDVKEYYEDCNICGVEADIKGLVVDYIYAYITMFISLIFSVVFTPYFIVAGLTLMMYFIKIKRSKVHSKAEEQKAIIKSEFPRFLGLLTTELEVGLPIEVAIELLCRKYSSLITREFLNSLNDVKLGAVGWQGALIKISEKYRVEDLSDFVLDVTTAFTKGPSITDVVRMRSKELKAERLYDLKEKAARAENTILIPIALFQFLPMIMFMLLPTIEAVSVL